jgi:NAD+ synthase (glutamine-hydrolysing)
MRRLRLGLAQINTTVGDFNGNSQRIMQAVSEARVKGVNILAFPELAICGYPPEDLLLKPQFIAENIKSLHKVQEKTAGITVITGFIDFDKDIYDSAAVLSNNTIAGIYHKIYLPNYGVFDENRYFARGKECPIFTINGVNVGISICEDIWYENGPVTAQALSGAEVIINISASPYNAGKDNFREKMLGIRAADNASIVAYVNLVGGQDELVFDGNSMVFDEKGICIARGKHCSEDMVVIDLDVESVFRSRLHDPRWRKATEQIGTQWSISKIVISESPSAIPNLPISVNLFEHLTPEAEIYDALVLGTRDYIRKNNFKKVVLGLSGGIDSSLVAAIAMDALGSTNVTGVAMPSRYSSPGSLSDAKLLAQNLGIEMLTIPIDSVFQPYLDLLTPQFQNKKSDVTEENIQARIRGNILMALSNKFGWLVLTTGNKSEYAVGYTTLYGDMAGGFAVIKDVFKTMVYMLAEYRNKKAGIDIIPNTVIKKEPSAELRPGQKDVDSLPPYEILDPVLSAYVEEDKSIEQIINMGFNEEMVRKVARRVDISEYKRRQSPPGIKITPRAFGRDRRLPITNWYKE